MSLFVSIASYCDPVLGFTLARALSTARHPERLHFGVVDQVPADWPAPNPAALMPAQLSRLRVDPVHARGPCWARAVAMTLYDGEDWFLQVDSHMDFDVDWDLRFIEQANALAPGRPGFVISAYPNAFVFEGDLPVRKAATDKVLAHVVKPQSVFDVEHVILPFEAHPIDREHAVPGFHLGAGCLFAPGRIAVEFPYDPWYYFHGEEQALALRLYTHGWDIFHMPNLPVAHLYNTGASGGPARPMHWDAREDQARTRSWWEFEQRSRSRLEALATGRPLGVYGLGSARTMDDYAAFSGIDFARRVIAPKAYSAAGRDAPAP